VSEPTHRTGAVVAVTGDPQETKQQSSFTDWLGNPVARLGEFLLIEEHILAPHQHDMWRVLHGIDKVAGIPQAGVDKCDLKLVFGEHALCSLKIGGPINSTDPRIGRQDCAKFAEIVLVRVSD